VPVEIDQPTLDYIWLYVRYGFYRPAEVEEILDDVFSGAIPRRRLRELIKSEVARHRAEQQSWPEVTDCDRLDRGFAALRTGGILAIHNAGVTPSEGIEEMSSQYRAAGGTASGIVGYCFYDRQEMERALKYHKFYVAYGDIAGDDRRGIEVGKRIHRELEAAGLRVAWTGSIREKLELTGFHWQRRK
jgi:hypothetical protein